MYIIEWDDGTIDGCKTYDEVLTVEGYHLKHGLSKMVKVEKV